MMKRILLVLTVMSLDTHAYHTLDYPSIWQCDTNKFHWYCDLDETRQPPARYSTEKKSARSIESNAIQTAGQLRQELKRREDVAVMDPSDQNIKDYLTLWQFTQDKGAIFADRWRRVVWQNPELDYSLKRPANNSAIKVYDEARREQEAQRLRHLAKEHGLIFFFRSDCPVCHAMAPALKKLSESYGIEVLAVSVDGAGLKEFPKPQDGRMQAARWGVERVPALFIGSKQSGEHAPIGFGLMALSEIINRIFVLTGTQAGEHF